MTAERAIKEPCPVATTGHVNLTGLQNIDGVPLAAGDRVLVRAQASELDNGVWQVALGTWQRADDFDAAEDVLGGCELVVTSGTTLGGSKWRVSGHGRVAVGEASIGFENASNGGDLSDAGGAGRVGYNAGNPGAVSRSVQTKIREEGVTIEDFYQPGDGANWIPAFARAHEAYASNANRINPPPWGDHIFSNSGTGVIRAGRRLFPISSNLDFYSNQGAGLIGHGQFTTQFQRNTATGAGASVTIYDGFRLHDFTLRNDAELAGGGAAARGTSIGVLLGPTGGGGNLSLQRLSIIGWGTGIFLDGNIISGNGDKTLISQVSLICNIGVDNPQNKQAIGWTFLNPNGGCNHAFYRWGGGHMVSLNGTINLFGTVLEIPEGAGALTAGGFVSGEVVLQDTKVEYHGTGNRRLIDATNCITSGAAGARMNVTARNVLMGSGQNDPESDTHTVIKVGNGTSGADYITVRADGGYFRGRIEIASAASNGAKTRWHFRDMRGAPHPDTALFQGIGSHPMVEWRANSNVLIDQYRGGQDFRGSIDATKAHMWGHLGKALINTAVGLGADANLGVGIGANFTVPGFPPKCTVTGLGVFINDNPSGSDTVIEWYSDATFAAPALIASATVPAGFRGLKALAMGDITKHQVTTGGAVYVRITKPGTGQIVEGHIVVFYFPYMGT